MGTLGGYLGIPPAFRTQLPHTEECSAGMDELPRLHASPGKMSPSLQGQTLRLVSHYGTGPMLGLSLPGSPRAFPPREGMGMLFSGLLFYFWGGGVGGKRSNRGPQAQEKPLGGHQAWTRAAPALGGCSHLDTWDGKAQAPISFKKRSKKPKTKKGTTMTYNAVSIPIIHISEPR